MSMREYSHLVHFPHDISIIFHFDDFSVQTCPSVSTHLYSSAFLKWGPEIYTPQTKIWERRKYSGNTFCLHFSYSPLLYLG